MSGYSAHRRIGPREWQLVYNNFLWTIWQDTRFGDWHAETAFHTLREKSFGEMKRVIRTVSTWH